MAKVEPETEDLALASGRDGPAQARGFVRVAIGLRLFSAAILFTSSSPAAGTYLLCLPLLVVLVGLRLRVLSHRVAIWVTLFVLVGSVCVVPVSWGPGIWNGLAIGWVDALSTAIVVIAMALRLARRAVRRLLRGPARGR